MAVALQTLISEIPGVALTGDPSLAISGVTADSREAGPGVLFVAVRGTGGDGHRFVAQAVAAGSPVVVVESSFTDEISAEVAVIRCERTRNLPALLARALHGAPDRQLWTVAITGTNGKTTTAFLVQEMLRLLHDSCLYCLKIIPFSSRSISFSLPLKSLHRLRSVSRRRPGMGKWLSSS